MLIPLLLSFIASLTAGAPARGSQLPDTPAAAQLTALVGRYNRGELQEPRWQRWRQLIGTVTIEDVVSSTPTDIHVWLRGTVTRGWIGLRVRVQAAPPHELAGDPIVFYGPIPDPGPEPAGPVDARAFKAAATTYLRTVSDADFFSGAVVISLGSQAPIVAGGYGLASREYGRPNSADTKFNLASLTKMFTAVAIAQLADRGKLSLDDTVARHLPDLDIPHKDRITIHQLLTHTAGLGRGAFNESSVRDRVVRSVADQLKTVKAPAEFEPGSSARYNNEAWVVLGAIVERVSGQDYYAYLDEHIFKPAGMTASGRFDGDLVVPDRATGYSNLSLRDRGAVYVAGPRRNTLFLSSISGSPSGGTYSSANDLRRFFLALRQHRLLSAAMTDRLFTKHASLDGPPGLRERRGFAYGLETRSHGWLESVGKSGGSAGASTEIHYYPKFDCLIVVVSNYDDAGAVVERHLRELMVESAVRRPSKTSR